MRAMKYICARFQLIKLQWKKSFTFRNHPFNYLFRFWADGGRVKNSESWKAGRGSDSSGSNWCAQWRNCRNRCSTRSIPSLGERSFWSIWSGIQWIQWLAFSCTTQHHFHEYRNWLKWICQLFHREILLEKFGQHQYGLVECWWQRQS